MSYTLYNERLEVTNNLTNTIRMNTTNKVLKDNLLILREEYINYMTEATNPVLFAGLCLVLSISDKINTANRQLVRNHLFNNRPNKYQILGYWFYMSNSDIITKEEKDKILKPRIEFLDKLIKEL